MLLAKSNESHSSLDFIQKLQGTPHNTEVRKIQTNNSWLPTITVFPIQWRSKTEKTLIAQQTTDIRSPQFQW